MLNTLRSIYKELLLYPIPKIGRIFEAVTSEDLDMILKEIPNIFISHQKNAVQLKQHIQVNTHHYCTLVSFARDYERILLCTITSD